MERVKNVYLIDKKAIIEIVFIILFYSLVALSSIINLGLVATIGSLFLITACSYISPRTGLAVLLSFFYLPTYQLGLPAPFIIATLVVAMVNYKYILKKSGFQINSRLIVLYVIFLLFRFVSILFVNNLDVFWSYFSTSFSVLIHLLVFSNLVNKKEDIFYILRIWGVIGAMSAVLGYLHFIMQDTVYLRQIFVSTGDFDKSTIDGTYDFVRWIWAGVEPNFMGLILLIPFVINFFFLMKRKTALNVVLTLVTFLGILGTYSRTSFIVALAAIFIFFIASSSLKNKLVFVFLFAIGGILLINYFSEFIDRIDSISEALNESEASGRFPLYKEAINNFLSNPLLGIGTGQTALYSKYRLESHNLFLQTLGENGIVSFAILIFIFYAYLKKSIKLRKEKMLYMVAGIGIFLNANTVSYFDLRVFFSLYVLLNFEMYYRYFNVKNNFKIDSFRL